MKRTGEPLLTMVSALHAARRILLDGSPANGVRPAAEGRIPAISLGPLQGRLTVSRFKPLIGRPS
jgi:hypothetical protein